jgi:hypothetical protein
MEGVKGYKTTFKKNYNMNTSTLEKWKGRKITK